MIIGYNFYKNGVKVNATPHPQPSYTFDDLVPGVEYDLQATAVDGGGNESPRSTVLHASTVQVELPPPGGEMLLVDRNGIDAIVTAAQAVGKQKGIVISTTGPRGYYTKAYGTSSGSTPVTADDHFRIGSITKVFVANAILQQVDAGAMTLEDTVDQYVDGVPNGHIMTIRHLLTMRSGVYTTAGDYITALLFILMPSMSRTREQNMAAIRRPAGFLPGAKYQYNNLNYVLLGVILETITGRAIHNIITDDVITPMGLVETTFPTGNTIPSPSGANGTNGANIDPDWYEAAGSIISTIGDLIKFGEQLRDGALISTDSHALWETEFCGYDWIKTGPDQFGYGLGMMSFGRWIGYNGAVVGFGSAVFYDPVSETVVAILQNSGPSLTNLAAGGEPLHPLFYEIGKYLMPGSMDSPGYPSCEPGILNMPALLTVPVFGTVIFVGGIIRAASMATVPVFGVPGLSNKLVLPSIVATPVFGLPLIAMTVPSMTTEPVFEVAATYPYLVAPSMTTTPTVGIPSAWLTRMVEVNVEVDNAPLPPGATGVVVGPIIGGGGGGGCGYRKDDAFASGGSGGGGAAKSDPLLVPVELLGETYSTTRGSGGAGGSSTGQWGGVGEDSVFESGDVTIVAGGGEGGGPGQNGSAAAGGAGGTGTAIGASVTFRSGTAGRAGTGGGTPLTGINNTVGGAPGGGAGGGLNVNGTGGSGGKGGNSVAAAGGAGGATASNNNAAGSPGANPGGGVPGGGGGGAGGGLNQRAGGVGGAGAGGGGGGAFNSVIGEGGAGGDGGSGHTVLTWYLSIETFTAESIIAVPVFGVPLIISPLPVPSIVATPVMAVAKVYSTLAVPAMTATPTMGVAGVYTTMTVPAMTTTPVMGVASITNALLVIVGSTFANTNSIDFSALGYAAGDIIVVFAFNAATNTTPSKPTPGGTIPTYTDIEANAGANLCASRTAQFVTANTSHTSGAWGGGVSKMLAVALRGQAASPIGGHAEAGATAIAQAPSITMSDTSGRSVLLHLFGRRSQLSAAWSAAPAGYTQRAQSYPASQAGVCLDTKDVTTSDGAVTQDTNNGNAAGFRAVTVEVLAA